METKTLSFEEMESIEGGWKWSACLGGAMAAISTGLVGYATAVGGPIGTIGALAAGCVIWNVL